MANSITLVSKFVALIDTVYKLESKTAMLDALTQTPDFLGANEIKVMKLSAVGLGTYSRVTGYPAGNITAAWETMTLATERGRQFTLDRMDNEETLGLVLGGLIREWMRAYVAPELDAYRFAKYAAGAGLTVASPATLSTAATVLAAIDAGNLAMSNQEVPEEGRKLFITYTLYELLKASLTRTWTNDGAVSRAVTSLESTQVIPVPQSRFYSAIDLDAGATGGAGGFAKSGDTGTADLNFMIVAPSAVLQPIKLNMVKYFSPDVWQGGDFHAWQYRLYHDAFVYDNKVNGIYTHLKDS
jgi:hypothetical protein